MAWIFVDKESEGGGTEKMRQQMRRNMRGGGYRYPMMRHGEDGYETRLSSRLQARLGRPRKRYDG